MPIKKYVFVYVNGVLGGLLSNYKNDTLVLDAGKNKIDDILKLAVKRMLPGGPLAKKQLSKLKIYEGNKHPHEVQNPTVINFKDLNKKNTVRI